MRKVCSLLSLVGVLNCSDLDYSPGGIAVNKNGYSPNMEMIDVKYDAVEHCLREKEILILNGKEDAVVYIITNNDTIKPCPDPAVDFCYGYYCLELYSVGCNNVGDVVIPENLRKLGHEFVHHQRKNGDHDSILSICGMKVDNNINGIYLHE